MKLSGATKLFQLLESYPFLLDFLAEYRPHFAKLKNPVLRNTLGRFATLQMASTMGEVPLDQLIAELREVIRAKTGELVEIEIGDASAIDAEKVETLKGIIGDLHAGAPFEEVKERFRLMVKDVTPNEIAQMEQSLINGGLPHEEVKKLCDVHVSIFKDALDKLSTPEALPGHPVHTFVQENRALKDVMNQLRPALESIDWLSNNEVKEQLIADMARLGEFEKHYLRKEYQLFPFLEKHGITGPSQVMWAVHDDIRAQYKKVRVALSTSDGVTVAREVPSLFQAIEDMFYKEEQIMFPMAMGLLEPSEWVEIRKGEKEFGYALIQPGDLWSPDLPVSEEPGDKRKMLDRLALDTGLLTLDQVNLILTHLPVELSFVDENDEVRYYSDNPHKIFPRSPEVIGRKVQNCHPPKSVHIVTQILASFKSGARDVAEFWIQQGEAFVYIRYFAVRDKQGKYRGSLEVVQEVAGIRKLEGEQRLLGWK